MAAINHDFTKKILDILDSKYHGFSENIFYNSHLIQYLNIKTKAANRGSKSRAGFANHYAIYVLVEDYINHGFHKNDRYVDYEGAQFTNLFRRQRRHGK